MENIILRVPSHDDPAVLQRFDGELGEVAPGDPVYSEQFNGVTCNFRRLDGVTEKDGGETKAVFEYYGSSA